ncbi:hypothetical protein HID58_015835, partial [Brassica napus]
LAKYIMNSCKVTLLGFTILRWVSKLIRKRHESSVTNVAWHTNNPKALHFEICLFVMWVLFISEKMVISVGYDSNPMVFAADDTGICLFLNFSSNIRNLSLSVLFCLTRVFIVLCFQFSEAFTKFYGQSKATTANEASESSKSRGSVHDNCINSIVSLSKAGSPQVMRFSTSGLDGKIAIWDLGNMQEELGHQF